MRQGPLRKFGTLSMYAFMQPLQPDLHYSGSSIQVFLNLNKFSIRSCSEESGFICSKSMLVATILEYPDTVGAWNVCTAKKPRF